MLLTLTASFGFGQLEKTYTLKFNPGAAILGEYQFNFEKRLSKRKFLWTSAGYFNRSNRVDAEDKNRSDRTKDIFRNFFTTGYNKWLYSSAGYYYRDFETDRERLHGPVVRGGIRQYFLTDYAPQGAHVYLGLHYGFIFATAYDENLNVTESLNFHKPGASVAGGYQWLIGFKKKYCIDLFAGLEYFYFIQSRGWGANYEWQNTPNLVLMMGASLGFAFRQKNRHL